MAYIRTLHIRSFKKSKERFDEDLAMQNYKGSISIFDFECASKTSSSICEHIRLFYPNTVGSPSIYWIIEESIIKNYHKFNKAVFKYTPSITKDGTAGDSCHLEIFNIDDADSALFVLEHCKPPNIYMCLCNKDQFLQISNLNYSDLKAFAKIKMAECEEAKSL